MKDKLGLLGLSFVAAFIVVSVIFPREVSSKLTGVLYGDAAIILGDGAHLPTSATQGVRISSNAAANQTLSSMGFLGAHATRPLNHRVGDFFWDTTKGQLAMSTAAFTNSTSGWMYTATDIHVWTTY